MSKLSCRYCMSYTLSNIGKKILEKNDSRQKWTRLDITSKK